MNAKEKELLRRSRISATMLGSELTVEHKENISQGMKRSWEKRKSLREVKVT